MVDTARGPDRRGTDVYARMGVRTIVNGRGATTAVGGTLPWPEVMAAMAEAAHAFVVLDELNDAIGRRIAEVTGAEAGYVTAGSAAGMALAAAACIAGNDPELIRRLPETAGIPNEIVLHRAHRLNYDQMYRIAGGVLVEIGFPAETEPWELERAITPRTAAVAYHDSPATGTGALPFETVVQIAGARGVPVIVDAASTLPPVNHLRRWIRRGADLVVYSGGKGIRGPQDSGLLAGRADLVAAAKANGSPNAGIGRGMKVSKEAMVGLGVALECFLAHDHAADHREHGRQANAIAGAFAGRPDIRATIEDDRDRWPAPVIWLVPAAGTWDPTVVRDELAAGDPSIHVNAEHGGLMINTHCLLPGDEEMVVAGLRRVLAMSASEPGAEHRTAPTFT